MADHKSFTNVRSLLGVLAEAMNLINPAIKHHHEQTAYLAYMLARRMGLDEEQVTMALYAAILHDVGSVILEKQVSVYSVEKDAQHIAMLGANMLKELPEFRQIGEVVEYCQCRWEHISKDIEDKGTVIIKYATVSAVIHLADWISIMLKPEEPVLNQVKKICSLAEASRGTEFLPEAVDALHEIRGIEFIWLDVLYNPSFLMLFTGELRQVSLEEAVRLTGLMSRIIDFRSPFTAMHSAGVAASAKKLAELAGMSEEECMMMEIAGNLHDIGKLKVPREILEKPGKLTDEEFNIIKEHSYFTRLILMNVEGFEKIADWAGYHHEKLNGKGYPFHLGAEQLDQGSRIMAVADIFSAITEERPYRKGMGKAQAMDVLKSNVEYGAICGEMVQLLFDHYDEVDSVRAQASKEAGKRYFSSLESA